MSLLVLEAFFIKRSKRSFRLAAVSVCACAEFLHSFWLPFFGFFLADWSTDQVKTKI